MKIKMILKGLNLEVEVKWKLKILKNVEKMGFMELWVVLFVDNRLIIFKKILFIDIFYCKFLFVRIVLSIIWVMILVVI